MGQLKDDESFRTFGPDDLGIFSREEKQEYLVGGESASRTVHPDDAGIVSEDDDDEQESLATSGTESHTVKDVEFSSASSSFFLKAWKAFLVIANGVSQLILWTVKACVAVLKFGCFILCAFATIRLAFAILNWYNSVDYVSPEQKLASFVVSTQNQMSSEVTDIEEIGTERFESFAATYCLEGTSLQMTRDALVVGLESVPTTVRDTLVRQALQEGITATNSWRNSSVDIEVRSTAHSYFAFYSTGYEKDFNGLEKYKTCVMVTGISFTVKEVVVGYETIEDEYENGHRLECGFLYIYCSKVPKYSKRTTVTPRLKRSVLTLKQQRELELWMIQRAVESAGHLVAIGQQGSGHLGAESMPPLWKHPKYLDSEL